ncbi:Inositol oxygenase [Phytophthora citrophthora]|uniref:Inositol oxygenase n=1 Tax=Phytophthora citrophthora TaxID=4793 RepID=A0AAD9GKV8_9STRA|nr:Inositol oxygenase [Phytophthora citrophthora]
MANLALSPPLGTCVPLTEALPAPAVRFRLQFTDDRRTKELRWVLFACTVNFIIATKNSIVTNPNSIDFLIAATQRGAIGKLIFTLEKNGTAHVKSIVVNKDFRGLGLARVLYLATLATLEEKQVGALYLEAEEDSKRHGRLVGLYQGWGFAEIADANVLILYNGNECLRKVPMVSMFQKNTFFPVRPKESTWFCMMMLQTLDGTCVVAGEDGDIEVSSKTNGCMWQTLLGATGEVFLRSVHGKFLCVEEDGTILADRPLNSTWETFQVVPHHGDNATSAGGVALQSFHGSYLCIDPLEKKVEVSDHPVPWDGGEIMSLVCNKADPHPLFTKIMRKYQTATFVTNQIAKYGALDHAQMSIPEACKCVMELTGESERKKSWIIKYMLATATAVRDDGHPDWLQLAVFLRALGMLFLCWTDDENAVLRSISAQEWMVKNSLWVVGERIPSSIECPDLNELNTDHCNAEKGGSSNSTHCGLENCMLPWTPDEYLHRVLSRNRTTLPAEALDLVRFWSLKTWYEQNNYDELCAPQDVDTKEWICSLGKVACVSEDVVEKINVEDELQHYLLLAEKYLPDTLQW